MLRRGFSTVIKASDDLPEDSDYKISGLKMALKLNNVDIRIFGKQKAWAGRRLGVILSSDRENGMTAKSFIKVEKK